MRSSDYATFLHGHWLIASLVTAVSAPAQESVVGTSAEPVVANVLVTPELVEAHRNLQLAKLAMHKFRFVELPRQRRFLDAQIKLAESKNRDFRGRIRAYRPISQIGRYSPVQFDEENYRLALQANEALLRQLKEECIALLRTSRYSLELYGLDILQAATRLAAVHRSVVENVESQYFFLHRRYFG